MPNPSEININVVHHGKCLDVIKTFPDKSINSVITSPPYWQLRDYKWDGQWGLEPTFQMYLENLWSLMDEIWRVLKDDGTVWINLGDTYSGSNGFGWKQSVANDNQSTGGEDGNVNYRKLTGRIDEAPAKCLLLIPHRFGIGCIDRGWVMRNDIIWAKRNGMPESVNDRFSKKHEYFFFMTKQQKYYFDLDGVKDKSANAGNVITLGEKSFSRSSSKGLDVSLSGNSLNETYTVPQGKNPGTVSDFWDIPTKPSLDEHYAAYNDALIGKPIIAGCPKDGIILDPFCGTATTGCRALELGRKFIGIEGSEKYVKIANKNLHPYLITQQLF